METDIDAAYKRSIGYKGGEVMEPHTPRWRNAAQWARNSMVNEGLLKSDSQRGVWEITLKGERFLEDSDKC